MTKLFKLTTQDGRTRVGYDNETLWGEGVTHTAPGDGGLCTASWVHAYTDPFLAMFFNRIHADIDNPAMWECEGEVGASDELKVGCTSLTTLRMIPVQHIELVQRVRFAVMCARFVYNTTEFVSWSGAWLSGSDRSYEASYAQVMKLERKLRISSMAAYLAAYSAMLLSQGMIDQVEVSAARSVKDAVRVNKTLNLFGISVLSMTEN